MITEVYKGDARDPEEMLDPEDCSHNRIYQGSREGWWYCADCPAYAQDKRAFDGRTGKTPRY